MSYPLLTVEQAAQQLGLHPKTLLRYIRAGRLPATRVGKSYRILPAELDEFAGLANRPETGLAARTTCITDIPGIASEAAERLVTFLQSAALTGDASTPALHLETAFDPLARTLKVVAIGSPPDVARLLEILHLHMTARA